MRETWRPVVGYEGRYEVSDRGRVRALFGAAGWPPPPRLLSTTGSPYPTVTLRRDGTSITRNVHVLVLTAFVGPCPTGMQCRHLDGNPRNNTLSNLRWGTRAENNADTTRHGRAGRNRGERHARAVLTAETVTAIRQRVAAGESQRSVARAFGIGQPHVSRLARGARWAHVS